MRKFILELGIILLPFFLTGYIFYNLGTPSPLANNIRSIQGKLEIINLGTSHGNNFDYSECKLRGRNMNREGNTLYYDLQNYLFLNHSNYLSEKAIIIIPVSYYVFGLDENRTDRLPDDSFVNDFYYYLPKEQIFSYSEEKKNRLILFAIQENFKALVNSNSAAHDNNLSKSEPELKKHAAKRVDMHKKLSTYSSTKKNINYLSTLLDEIIKDNNIPILVSTPCHYSYNEEFTKAWLDENYFRVMNELSEAKNISYLDYSHDKRFTFTADYFYDSDHLNNAGKKVFNSIFFRNIRALLHE